MTLVIKSAVEGGFGDLHSSGDEFFGVVDAEVALVFFWGGAVVVFELADHGVGVEIERFGDSVDGKRFIPVLFDILAHVFEGGIGDRRFMGRLEE